MNYSNLTDATVIEYLEDNWPEKRLRLAIANHLPNVELSHKQSWEIITDYLPELRKLILREFEATL